MLGVVVLLFLGLLIVSGSLIWSLLGLNSLDINGIATVNDRPRVTIGKTWAHYGGDKGGSRYSQADQITRGNVSKLQIAWTFSTGDTSSRPKALRSSASEGTAILLDEKLIICTPFNEVIALDPASGRQYWRYDAKIDLDQMPANQFVCRGIESWRDSTNTSGACSSRIFMGTNDGRLVALDANTGAACESFGDRGEIVIDPGIELVWPGEFQITSPPVVVGNTVIVGSAIADNLRRKAPAGAVRAYDTRTGTPKWVFDPIPRSAAAAKDQDWQSPGVPVEGHANVWAPMSVDEERGLVFLPTSSPSPDFFGGLRPGDNRFANSVVALDGETGAVVWSFQTVHHDLWDYDLPAQPGLYSVWKNGRAYDVVAQVTKMGLVFVLDRETGEPFLPVEERPVSQDGVPGEAPSPTQPFPVMTPPVVPNEITPKDAFGVTWLDKRACAKSIRNASADGLFTPPSEKGSIVYPFTGGGANWGGTAFDPRRNLLVVNMSNIMHMVQLVPTDPTKSVEKLFYNSKIAPQSGTAYGVKRDIVLSPIGLPCNRPPWGVIAGIDLETGEIVWRSTLGTTEDYAPIPALALGTPNIGGPIVTAGGLIFIGAAMDDYLRAFDVETGDELWKGRLPAGGQATPITYDFRGKQYVVIFAGGNARLKTTLGDQVVAFALPD